MLQSVKKTTAYKILLKLFEKYVEFKNRRMSDVKELKRLKGKYNGKRCFIIGSGPSLTISDLDKLKGEYCFASNKIYSVFSNTEWRPTFYVVSDNDITQSMYNVSSKFDSQTQAKFFPANFREGCKVPNNNAFFFNYKGCDTTGQIPAQFSNDISKLVYEGFSVAYVAMQIAAYMGFSEIYLLGLDFSWPIYKDCAGNIYENGEVKHRFYQDNDEKNEISIPNVEIMEKAYQQALKYCNENDIKIFNATRGGKLEVFQRINADDLFV